MTYPDRLPLTSLDLADDRRALLRKNFPEVFREDKIDFEALQRALGEWVDPGKERFGLNWPGKAACAQLIQQTSVGTLQPMREQSVDFDTTENLIIEGDNLEVLKLLQKSYYGKVKMIYIDPPYNTGNEFIYPDNFREGLHDYMKYSGQVDGEGYKQSSNTETGGRYHSNWLSMMYPRLFLARNLMREDGVIFVSIDDHEVHNLRSLMNEVFGDENFIANVIWQKKYTRSNDAKWFSDNHDHILVFSIDKSKAKLNLLPRSDDQIAAYSNPCNHHKGVWKATPLHAKSGVSRKCYTFKNGICWEPPIGTFRRFSNETMAMLDDGGEVWFGDDGYATPSRKSFLTEVKDGVTPVTLWPHTEVGHNHEANSELKFLLGEGVFDNPKPSRLIQRMLVLTTNSKSEDIVLDFFSGSGTTAHSVMEINKEDSGNRKFILVQLPEPTDNSIYPTIADITRERVRRVSAKLKAAQPAADLLSTASIDATPDLGFKAMRLTSSNFKVWDGRADQMTDVGATLDLFAEHVLPDRTSEDILYELLLKTGYPLTTPITTLTLAGKKVFSASEGALLICLEYELSLDVIEAMVACDPWLILCLDAGFSGQDQLKANAMQTVRAHNRNRQSSMSLKVV